MSIVSDREFEIVETVVRYGSKKEAAAALNRSVYTVETTIKNVYEKLGFNKISDLTLWFCAVKFNIADQVNAFKNLTVLIILIIALPNHVSNDTKYRIRLYRRSVLTECNRQQARIRGKRKARAVYNYLSIHNEASA